MIEKLHQFMALVLVVTMPVKAADFQKRSNAQMTTDEMNHCAWQWLKSVQNPDGSWGDESPALTGLAVLAFLAPQGFTSYSKDEYLESVSGGIRFLHRYVSSLSDSTGEVRLGFDLPLAGSALSEWNKYCRDGENERLAKVAARRIASLVSKSGEWSFAFTDEVLASAATQFCMMTLANVESQGLGDSATKAALVSAVAAASNRTNGRCLENGTGNPFAKETALRDVFMSSPAFGGDLRENVQKRMAENFGGLTSSDRGRADLNGAFFSANRSISLALTSLSALYFVSPMAHGHADEEFRFRLAESMTVIPREMSGITNQNGRAVAIGFWDSPSSDEIRFVGDSKRIGCRRFANGVWADGVTTRSGRIQDTCLCLLSEQFRSRFYRERHSFLLECPSEKDSETISESECLLENEP